MRICVRLFAYLRERAGASQWELQVPLGTTVARALDVLARETGLEGEWMRRARPAVNLEYCEGDRVLQEDDELALIPPVSGG